MSDRNYSSGASSVPVGDGAKATVEVTAPWFGDRAATEEDVAESEDTIRGALGKETAEDDGEQDDQEDDEQEPVQDADDESEEEEEEQEEDEDDDVEPEPELPPKARANKRIRQVVAKVKERDQVIEALREELRASRAVQEQHLGMYQQQFDYAQKQRQEWEAGERMRALKNEFYSKGLDIDNNQAAKTLFEMYLKQQEMLAQGSNVNQFQSNLENERQEQAYYSQLDSIFDQKLQGFNVDPDVRGWLREQAIDKARLNQLTPELAVQAAFAQAQKLGIQPSRKAPKRKAPNRTEVQRDRVSARGSATVGRSKGETRGGRKPASARGKRGQSLEDRIFPEFGKSGHWG